MIRYHSPWIGLPVLSVAALLLAAGPNWAQRGGGGHGGAGHGGGGSGGGRAGSFSSGGHASSFSGSHSNGTWHHDGDRHGHDRFFFGYGYPFYGYGYPFYGYGYGYPFYGPYYSSWYAGYYPNYSAPYWDDPSYYGRRLGPTYTPDNYYGAPGYASATSPAQTADPNAAHLRVMVPASAQVWFEDERTTQSGPARFFSSPGLSPEKEYVYEIKAQWQEDGQPVTRQRRVMLHAGDWITVDFNRLAKGEPLPKPRPAD